jgi:excisionase family DNA binding protein
MDHDIITELNKLPVMLTVKDTERVLQLSRGMTYRVINTQGFPVIRFGRAIRIPREALILWIEQQAGT